ncbi:amino acid ABC transporter [Advenella kashmirensis W13003]|uniref:Amino acid ABC transporter n=1 Tax=Advenella kashmirensis W13003 TaxID=1424334 RepID=V8QS21_9BURK|nr:transporter substrate-binding domain-containing protein [Advenella kashmirensis]ETF02123.1 amino acid ABC transporter [Advenella kashmirensis W13003]
MTLLMKPAAAVAACATLLFGITTPVCANTLEQVMQQKVLRVAIDLNAPPYGMKNETMKEVGSDVETANLLAQGLGVKLEIVPTTQANRIPFLLTNKADIVISSLSITPERAKVIDFSVPYAVIQSVIGAPKDAPIKDMKDLVGKTVVTARGTTNDQNVTKLAPPGTNIVRFENDATAITAITSGQANIFSTAPSIIAALNKKDPAKALDIKVVMSTSKMGIGVAKNNTELKDKINELVRQNLKDGQLNTIFKKYHGTDLPQDVLAEGK